MSTYANYEKLSQVYDKGRNPLTADLIGSILPTLASQDKGGISLLDAGCGTGQYTEAFVNFGYRNITLFDASHGMLEQAKTRIEKIKEVNHDLKVDYKQGTLLKLPFEDQTFDAIIVNNVIHHLETSPDGINFPNVCIAFSEFNRVLRKGGVLSVLTSTPDQQRGSWYCNLMPTVLERYVKRLPDLKSLEMLMKNNGLSILHKISYHGEEQIVHSYKNYRAPLDKEWRALDSFWSLATDEETAAGIHQIEILHKNNKLEEFFLKYDQQSVFGSVTILFAKKS